MDSPRVSLNCEPSTCQGCDTAVREAGEVGPWERGTGQG